MPLSSVVGLCLGRPQPAIDIFYRVPGYENKARFPAPSCYNRDMKKFIDPDPSPGKLSHNPFAGLAGAVPNDLPQQETTPGKLEPAAPIRRWAVGKTRKGGFAISIERRAKGKHVTVVGNVSGDADALLRGLKKRCGAGGVVREGAIELQGGHQAAVLEFLKAPS